MTSFKLWSRHEGKKENRAEIEENKCCYLWASQRRCFLPHLKNKANFSTDKWPFKGHTMVADRGKWDIIWTEKPWLIDKDLSMMPSQPWQIPPKVCLLSLSPKLSISGVCNIRNGKPASTERNQVSSGRKERKPRLFPMTAQKCTEN